MPDQGSKKREMENLNSFQELDFDEALCRLEAVVQRLEKGELKLEEALALYQEGLGLLRVCVTKLANFEEKVDILLSDYYNQAPQWLTHSKLGEEKDELEG